MGPIDAGSVIAHAIELAQIPSPTFEEQRRRDALGARWAEKGLDPRVDDAGNLVARIRVGQGPAIMLCAHLDTVFSRSVDHVVERQGDRLVGPSIGDDSLGLAAVTALTGILPGDLDRDIWIIATVGEEGLGDLAGAKHVVAHPPVPLAAVIAVEGTLFPQVVTRGVGSVRWRVEVRGPGGHAWHESGRPSAVHVVGKMITELDALVGSMSGNVAVNVGFVNGGEAINARAHSATFEVDLRAEETSVLQELVTQAGGVVAQAPGVESSTVVLGDRPAGGIDDSHVLVTCAVEALRAQGIEPELTSASTDANAAFARGLPAITLGVTTGGDEHTEREWIETGPVETGLAALAQAVVLASERLG